MMNYQGLSKHVSVLLDEGFPDGLRVARCYFFFRKDGKVQMLQGMGESYRFCLPTKKKKKNNELHKGDHISQLFPALPRDSRAGCVHRLEKEFQCLLRMLGRPLKLFWMNQASSSQVIRKSLYSTMKFWPCGIRMAHKIITQKTG